MDSNEATKICKSCGETKHVSKFGKRRRNNKIYVKSAICTRCRKRKETRRRREKLGLPPPLTRIRQITPDGLQVCCTCKESLPIEMFSFRNKDKNIRHSRCKKCDKKYRHIHYLKYRNYYIEKGMRRYKKERSARQLFIFEYLKTHPCIDCGELDPLVLEFDHVIGKKEFDISYLINAGYALQRLLDEIEKCVVRCANCHRRKTAKSFSYYKLALIENNKSPSRPTG